MVPVEPATVAKVDALLNGRVCGRACLGSYDPALVPDAPIRLIKKDSTRYKSITEVKLVQSLVPETPIRLMKKDSTNLGNARLP